MFELFFSILILRVDLRVPTQRNLRRVRTPHSLRRVRTLHNLRRMRTLHSLRRVRTLRNLQRVCTLGRLMFFLPTEGGFLVGNPAAASSECGVIGDLRARSAEDFF